MPPSDETKEKVQEAVLDYVDNVRDIIEGADRTLDSNQHRATIGRAVVSADGSPLSFPERVRPCNSQIVVDGCDVV